ncbi:MAG: Rieske 2Fe-2S domain-containing protein [Saprospiraceae bacterium]|nr:Rieske 2Fe-2S domain-containing protein [Saprospiraceae bacterium]
MNTKRRVFLKHLTLGIVGVAAASCEDLPSSLVLLPPLQNIHPVGAPLDLTWKALGVKTITIAYSPNGGETWEIIGQQISAKKGFWTWDAPSEITQFAIFRISDERDSTLNARSAAPLQIVAAFPVLLSDYPSLNQIGHVEVFEIASFNAFAILTQDDNSLKVKSLTCTHSGCQVNWEASSRFFLCPCHGSVFNDKGCEMAGPADMPLYEHATYYQADSNILWVMDRLLQNGC